MITKPIIKQLLIDLIYTADAKPRFINNNWVNITNGSHLKRIDEAVDKLYLLVNPTRVDKALELICFDNEKDETIECVKLIMKLDNIEDKTQILDHVIGDDEYVIEQFEFNFTVQDFLNHIK